MTHGLPNTLSPNECTRKTTPSQKCEQVPLPRSPSKLCWCRPRRPTQTRPYVPLAPPSPPPVEAATSEYKLWRQHTIDDPSCQVPLTRCQPCARSNRSYGTRSGCSSSRGQLASLHACFQAGD